MSVANQIRRIKNAKAAIKEAIQNKGVAVSDDVKLDEYPIFIEKISTGGGDNNEYMLPDFFEQKLKSERGAQYLFINMAVYEADTELIDTIENLDMSNFAYYDGMFYNFNNPTGSASLSAPAGVIKELDLTKWKNMGKAMIYSYSNMFFRCHLDYLNVSGLDFTRIASTINFSMFECTYIKEINMSNCNVSTLKNFYRLCYQANCLVTINMTGCDTSKATNMNYMFGDCPKLETIIGELDASNLTNGFYPGSTTQPFAKCPSLETVYIKNIYKDIAVTNVAKFSIDLGVTKVKDECLVYIIDQLPNLADKGITNNTAIKLTLPTTNTLTDEQKQVALDKGWIVVN